MKKKKIVFVVNYFYPDFASTGQLMTELCLYLQNDFEITVVAAIPEGAEADASGKRFIYDDLENIEIVRIKLPKLDKSNKLSRLKYITAYFLFAIVALLKQRKTDVIYTISTPPVLGGLIGTIGKFLKGSKHIYNIQDFNPEQAEAVKYTKNKVIFGIARFIDNLSCKFADHVITVGTDMQETLAHRFAKNSNSIPSNSVINNWTDEQDIVPLDKDHPRVKEFLLKYGLLNKLIIMYSGNLGLYYDLENIIKLVKHFKDNSDVAFVFIGDGAVKKDMIRYSDENSLTNTHFLEFQPKDSIKYSLNAADIHWVVNQKGIKGVSVPSKIYGVMAAGKPVLGVLESGSEAHRLIVNSECGFVLEPEDYNGITLQLEDIIQKDRSELILKGLNGRKYLEEYLKKDMALSKYKKLLLYLTS
ncbi:glycosyltransferase WbuB [Paenibacillus pectinilyticus]|uniref:Glycosyltransferase WbuB n=1 Tax=Paenibacillus pectinilyticus TaxID=512399 RepID=A0A1C0ZRM0_9BACL|nr:glycosyltransferase family 4 protein [Paenibacillus pectinilyticus]OCT10708.1 glycosyltransferase WbuB [Paenibacillus pectinilyticus]